MPPAVFDRAFFRYFFSQIEDVGQHLIEHPKTGMLMVLIPAGKFLTDTDGEPFEVDLPAYYVAVHPVTNAQYARFIAKTGHRKPEQTEYSWGEREWGGDTFPRGIAEHPVVFVSREDATAYCNWAGLRLPTELEWEKAARGIDCRTFPWGNEWNPSRCSQTGDGHRTVGVWSYGQGGAPFGGLQLSGNVWEWCSESFKEDAYVHYRQGNLASSSLSSVNGVMRGGGGMWTWWAGATHHIHHSQTPTISKRRAQSTDLRCRDHGFRCVLGIGATQ